MTKEGTSFNKKEAQEVLLIIKDILNNKENIIDNSLKYFQCSQHQNQKFISYCFDCKKKFMYFLYQKSSST